jgi:hypothetical protein
VRAEVKRRVVFARRANTPLAAVAILRATRCAPVVWTREP